MCPPPPASAKRLTPRNTCAARFGFFGGVGTLEVSTGFASAACASVAFPVRVSAALLGGGERELERRIHDASDALSFHESCQIGIARIRGPSRGVSGCPSREGRHLSDFRQGACRGIRQSPRAARRGIVFRVVAEPTKTDTFLEPARTGRLLAFADHWVRRRPWVVLPMSLVSGALLAASDYERSRVRLVVVLLTIVCIHVVIDAARARGTFVTPARLAFSSAAILVAYGICAGATGGLASPLLALLVGIPIAATIAYGSSALSRGLLGLFLLILVLLALLPSELAGPHVPDPWHRLIVAVTFAYAVVTSSRNLYALAEAYVGAAERVAQLRESVLEQQKERVRSLEAMGASLAHELKNPLAAISGLVQLLERGESDEKSKERLAIVASEVERMRERLSDSLRFARPLDGAPRRERRARVARGRRRRGARGACGESRASRSSAPGEAARSTPIAASSKRHSSTSWATRSRRPNPGDGSSSPSARPTARWSST